MKKYWRLASMGLLLVGLAACAKHPQSIVNAPPSSEPELTTLTQLPMSKFSKGPHQGLLGVRQYYFNCGDSLFPARYRAAANVQANYLRAHPQATLLLQGYSSAGGSEGYNIAIAEQRAESVATYLQLQNVPKSQLNIVSMGSLLDAPYAGAPVAKDCRVDLVYL